MDIDLHVTLRIPGVKREHDPRVLRELLKALVQVRQHLEDGVPGKFIMDEHAIIGRHEVRVYEEM